MAAFMLKRATIKKTEQSLRSQEIPITDPSLPEQPGLPAVPESFHNNPGKGCLCVKQSGQAKNFSAFLKLGTEQN